MSRDLDFSVTTLKTQNCAKSYRDVSDGQLISSFISLPEILLLYSDLNDANTAMKFLMIKIQLPFEGAKSMSDLGFLHLLMPNLISKKNS